MFKKVVDFLENKIGYLVALTVGIFFEEILNKVWIMYILGVTSSLFIILLVVKYYLSQKEIFKTPLNNNSARKLNLFLRKFCKTIKKLDRNLENKDQFIIFFPEFDFTQNAIYINRNQIKVNSKNRSQVISKVCDNIISLKRILLEINKSEIRIMLGNFLVKYSNDDKKRADGYIDFLGWTKILNEQKQGIIDIEKGIELCKVKRETCKNKLDNQGFNDYTLKIIRGYRHLGTTYYTYKFDKNRCSVEESINAAYKYLTEINCDNDEIKKQYTGLVIGIKYNSILLQYYNYVEKSLSRTELNKIKKQIKILYEFTYKQNLELLKEMKNLKLNVEYIDADSIDKHRKIKICSLYSILNENKESKDCMKEIEDILDQNIYIDEAIELYIYDKINNIRI